MQALSSKADAQVYMVPLRSPPPHITKSIAVIAAGITMPNAVLVWVADDLKAPLVAIPASRGSLVPAIGVSSAVGAEGETDAAAGAMVVSVAVGAVVAPFVILGAGVAPNTSGLHATKSEH